MIEVIAELMFITIFCCIARLCNEIIILKDLEKRREFFARLDERVKEARLERSRCEEAAA